MPESCTSHGENGEGILQKDDGGHASGAQKGIGASAQRGNPGRTATPKTSLTKEYGTIILLLVN